MKNLLLNSTIFLTGAAAFAQLTVKPNGTTDSYVYVKNQILYVEQGIDLTPNPSATIEASIYLRDNGQLIQGGKSLSPEISTNTGTGFLSVQQNSNPTNAFAYYYWASPVGNPAEGVPTRVGNNKNFGLASIYEDTNVETGVGTLAVQS